jgi:hypothetical protein
MTRIGQGVAARVVQHVSVDPERQLGALANGLHEAVDGVRCERTPALSLEDEGARRIPLQFAQHTQFITPDRMNCGLAVLRPRTCSAGLRDGCKFHLLRRPHGARQ